MTHPISSMGEAGSPNAAIPRYRVAILAAFVIEDPGAVRDWTAGHSHYRGGQRRRIQARGPRRADAHNPKMCDHKDNGKDDQDRPWTPQRTALSPPAEQRHQNQEKPEDERAQDDHPPLRPFRDQ